ncbi:MAG: 2TM domain-containing protein [Saprospiraceae bacterium]
MTQEEIYNKAKEKVNAKKFFYIHFGIYLMGIITLFIINNFTTPGFWWFLFAVLGWGMGIIAHYLTAFGLPGKGENWEEEELEKEIKKLERKQFYQANRKHEFPLPDEKLDLKEIKKLRDEWDDRDFV